MGRMWCLLVNALFVTAIYAAPREYSIDELITEPRPGEEYVNIQTTSNGKVDLKDKAFTTSHRIPQTNRTQDFHTSHAIPSNIQRPSRSLAENPELEPKMETRVSYSIVEGTTLEPPSERVVTKTSIKMSKSKKVQKSVSKSAHDDLVDVKADEGVIDKKDAADDEELKIMKRKFSVNEDIETTTSEFSLPLRFNVPLEDDVKDATLNKHLLIPNPVLATTQEPPITTFNYKNIFEKTKKGQGILTIISDGEKDKSRYETIGGSESIKTAESKAIALKKDAKQEKKEKYKKEEVSLKEDSHFYVLPVNKPSSKHKEDNFDFVDVDEKILIPAGSSPSQSSRINIKKGPNGQDYEYEYVYYYYDEDEEDGATNGVQTSLKEGKVVSATTEKVYNGHDGPAKDEREQNLVQSTSTSGNKYLPTEAPKYQSKNGKKSRTEEVEVTKNETPAQNGNGKSSRGGNGNRHSSTNSNKPQEVNEVLPSSGRSGFRPRGRSSTTTTEEIPSIGEERLPSNTRFPPRARGNNVPATASPQPQETTARTRNREGSSQSRLRIPNSSLLDSSSFRTHASDASVDEDSGYDAELQRKAGVRGQSSDSSSRRGSRPVTTGPAENGEIAEVSRKPTIRKQTEEKRVKVPVEEDVEEEVPLPKVPADDSRRVTSTSFDQERSGVSAEGGHQVNQAHVPLREDVYSGQQGYDGQHVVNGQLTYTGQQTVGGQQTYTDQQVLSGPKVFAGQQNIGTQQAFAEHQLVGGQQTFVGQPQSEVQNVEYQRRPETVGEHATAQGGSLSQTLSQTSEYKGALDKNQESKYQGVDSTTENQAAVGLTSAMMEKVALDLYAILQQAQNENVRTNFVDGNSTDITTDNLNEEPTEYTTYGDELSSPVTTTTTTTTTTTPAPTTTTTTTTTPAPTQAAGRGRYRGRGPVGKSRSKTASTTTTEAPEEVTSPKTRGRYHANHGGRGSGSTFARKPGKPAAKETSQDAAVSEEASKASTDRSFGERPRNRFRSSGKVTSSPSTTAAPSPSGAPTSRGLSNDRFHARRRGGARGSLSSVSTQQTAGEENVEEDKHEGSQDNSGSPDEGTSSAPASKPIRPRIGGTGVRPLRPGPRAPLLLPQRGAAASTTTQLPEEHEEVEKEIIEQEGQVSQQNEENQETPTTQGGDALSRLKSRPRLRIGPNTNQRPVTPAPPPTNRRKLVSSLLPKRKPNEEKAAQKVEGEGEEKGQEEIGVEEEQAVPQEEVVNTTTEAEAKGLNGLLAGRRRNLNRRPGTLYSRGQAS